MLIIELSILAARTLTENRLPDSCNRNLSEVLHGAAGSSAGRIEVIL